MMTGALGQRLAQLEPKLWWKLGLYTAINLPSSPNSPHWERALCELKVPKCKKIKKMHKNE